MTSSKKYAFMKEDETRVDHVRAKLEKIRKKLSGYSETLHSLEVEFGPLTPKMLSECCAVYQKYTKVFKEDSNYSDSINALLKYNPYLNIRDNGNRFGVSGN